MTDFLNAYHWVSAGARFRNNFLDHYTTIDGSYRVDPVHTQIDVSKLPWYEDVRLIRLTDRHWDNAKLALYYLLHNGEAWFRLNGSSPPIHEINSLSSLNLDQKYVLDYLRFFCFFVHGEFGPFYVLESMDDGALSQQLDEKSKAHYNSLLFPAECLATDEEGHFKCKAVICYSDAIFSADFEVKSSGLIEMLDDDMIDNDTPFFIDAPIVFDSTQ